MNQPRKTNLRLLFARQEKLSLSVACILILSAPEGTTQEEALAVLKEATVAWFDAETDRSLACQRYAGIDVNIGDLDGHGAFSDPVFTATLAKRDFAFLDLLSLNFDFALSYDTPLFGVAEEPVRASAYDFLAQMGSPEEPEEEVV